jgi:hypothetical protein
VAKINQIADMKYMFKFRAWAGADTNPMHFDESGVLRYENKQGVICKKDLFKADYEIICDHPVESLAMGAERFIFQCTKCDQVVQILSVRTVRPPHASLPDKIELKPHGQIPV